MSAPASSPSRDQLVATATRLFYERGIAATGVDTIVAEAGVSKPTLYTYFRTKHCLVAAVLENEHRHRRAALEAHLRDRSTQPARERLLSVFDWIAGHQRGEWARGCPFVNASVEVVAHEDARARDAIRAHKLWFRRGLTDLLDEVGAPAPSAVASQFHLLIEGANARMAAEGDRAAIRDARRAAEMLLDHALAAGEAKDRGRRART